MKRTNPVLNYEMPESVKAVQARFCANADSVGSPCGMTSSSKPADICNCSSNNSIFCRPKK